VEETGADLEVMVKDEASDVAEDEAEDVVTETEVVEAAVETRRREHGFLSPSSDVS